MRILVAEDEPSLHAQFADSLRANGYVVDTASDLSLIHI